MYHTFMINKLFNNWYLLYHAKEISWLT